MLAAGRLPITGMPRLLLEAHLSPLAEAEVPSASPIFLAIAVLGKMPSVFMPWCMPVSLQRMARDTINSPIACDRTASGAPGDESVPTNAEPQQGNT